MTKNNNQEQRQPVKVLAFVLGFTSIVAQVVLLRELVTVFYGNETAYAVILASWLFWISLGSFTVSRLTARIKDSTSFIAVSQWLIFFILPLTIVFARFIKQIMDIPTGMIVGIVPMCVGTFLLLAPLTFLLGALFTFICHLFNNDETQGDGAQHIGTVYLWESLGAAVGGFVFSFILIHFMPSMHVVFLIGIINIAAVLWLCRQNKCSSAISLGLIFITIAVLAGGVVSQLDHWTRQVQWKGLEIITITDSIYGNITMTREGGEYSLYENGLLSYTTKDDLTSEEGVHYPLLEHPDPKHVLLIGTGIAGQVREILKYADTDIDYIELDPKVVQVSQSFLPKGSLEFLRNPRVNVIYSDARLFVKRTTDKYDVIIVNLGDPYTALINRYYTLEFFQEANRVLHSQGIISFSVTSSENYLNQETRAFLRSINSTLSAVFPEVKSIPGDINTFLACKQPGVLTLDPQILIDRLKTRGIQTKYIREYYLPFKLSEDRIRYIEDILKEKGEVNTDARPITYFYDIVLWSTYFDGGFKNILQRLQWIRFPHLLGLVFIIFLIGWVFKTRRPTSPVTLAIMTTGFSEIIFQLIVILAFQTLYGYAYYKIGLIIAFFMLGLVLGSLLGRKIVSRTRGEVFKIYKIAQFCIFLYPLFLPFLFVVFRDAAIAIRYPGLFASVFAALPVIAGFLGGLQYPLANRLVSRSEDGDGGSQPAGFLYAVDVLGAAIGALVTGTILIPLLGINAVAFFCAALNGAVLILLLLSKK